MVYCENCGSDNTDGAKFCKNCGQKLPNVSSLGSVQPVQQYATNQEGSYTTHGGSVGFGEKFTKENLVLKCNICGGQDFSKDTGRLDSKFGFTSFKVIMMTCKRCGKIELFNKGRSIFDFD